MCFRGVREEPVSQPAEQVWEAAAALAFAPHRLFFCHRAAFLCPFGGENPHRNSDKGHAAVWKQLQLALHAYSVEESLQWCYCSQEQSHTSDRVILARFKNVCRFEQEGKKNCQWNVIIASPIHKRDDPSRRRISNPAAIFLIQEERSAFSCAPSSGCPP